MALTMYAHMNKWIKKEIPITTELKKWLRANF
jgi:hypothetical protein